MFCLSPSSVKKNIAVRKKYRGHVYNQTPTHPLPSLIIFHGKNEDGD